MTAVTSPTQPRELIQRSLDVHLTLRWWLLLSTIAIINIGIWMFSYLKLTSHDDTSSSDVSHQTSHNNRNEAHPYQRYHLFLSGIYVFVCAYRSFLPRIDLERYCLFDTRLSSIFLGRLSATIAEVSFSAQIALYLYHVGEVYGHPLTQWLALGLIPLIVIAQCFCWCGVVTLNHLYHAIEESIWAISSLFIGMAMAALAIYQPHSCLRVGVAGTICCLLFFLFMVIVDVPMYVRRWKLGKQNMMQSKEKKRIYMNMVEGSFDSIERRVVTKSWKVWKEETVWLTLYFSTAVWLSLLLIHKSIQNW